MCDEDTATPVLANSTVLVACCKINLNEISAFITQVFVAAYVKALNLKKILFCVHQNFIAHGIEIKIC